MDLDLNDTLPFGKYKSQKVKDVLDENPGWMLWLREERRTKQGDTRFFSAEVNALLDDKIRQSKSLRKNYTPWGELPPTTGVRTEAKTELREDPATTYEGSWGAF